jgi:hypothetical protein
MSDSPSNVKIDSAAADWSRAKRAGEECLAAALEYASVYGWASEALCTPDHVGMGRNHCAKCDHPGKVPWHTWKDLQARLPTEDEIRGWWKQNPLSNVGITLGGVTGLIGPDIDGPEGEALLRDKSRGDVPLTLEFTSGRKNGGRRLLYKIPAGVKLRTTGLKGVEVGNELRLLGLGAQTVMPPSRHKDGARYAWKPGHSPRDIEAAIAPDWLLARMVNDTHRSNGKAPAVAEGEIIKEKTRNVTLTSLAGSMRRRGMGRDAILAALLVTNEQQCDPPLPEQQVHKIADSISGYAPANDPIIYFGKNPSFLANYHEVTIDEKPVKIGLAPARIAADLHRIADGWPKRVEDRLFAEEEHRLLWLDSTDALFAWIARQLPDGQDNPVNWVQGGDKVTQAQFAAFMRQTVERFEAVEIMPHEPRIAACHYCHPAPQGGDGKALARFLDRFEPATLIDKDLIRAAALSLLWGGPPGQRPAFLIESADDDKGGRGVGKSKLAQALAKLAGGHIDARPNEDIDKLMTRLLSPAAMDRRVVFLDNVKTLRFSWSDLEAIITGDIISGRRLYAGEGRRPNTLVWFITLNQASLSRDMAQRTIPIRLKRPQHDSAWEAETWRLIEEERWAIVGDLLAELRRPVKKLARYSRWSAWEQAVLSHVAEPADCQKVIEERQDTIDDDKHEADIVRGVFVNELRARGHDPLQDAVWLSSVEVAGFVSLATGERTAPKRATSYLRTLSIPELRKCDYLGQRGWAWRGLQCPIDKQLADLKPEPFTRLRVH